MINKLDGPAWIEYYSNGIIKTEKYYISGVLIKENPSTYYEWYGDEEGQSFVTP